MSQFNDNWNPQYHGRWNQLVKTGVKIAEAEMDGKNIEIFAPGSTGDYLSLRRVDSYLYEATFDAIPEFNECTDFIPAGCSSFVRDGKLHRNLDWYYDNTADFIVRCKDFEGMAFIAGQEDGKLDFEVLGQLPYNVKDGVNKDGIMVCTHVVNNDWQWDGSGEKKYDIRYLPYYILTHLHEIDTIEGVLEAFLNNAFVNASMKEQGYLTQYLVTDGTTTYVISPPDTKNGVYSIRNASSNPKLTNFRWVEDATVDRADLQLHPNGVARWNLIDENTTLEDLKYTNAYQFDEWLDEFIGINETTKDSTDEELHAIWAVVRNMWLYRERDGQLWQTCYSVTYGPNGMEHLFAQENYEKDYIATGGGETGPISADQVTYSNTGHTEFTNVKDTLDGIIAKVYYVAPEITSFTASPAGGNFENGQSVSAPTFTWELNKDVTSQSLTDCTVTPSSRTATYGSAITTTKEFTLTVSDGENSATSKIKYSFMDKMYWGSAATGTYDSAFILALSNKKLVSAKKGSYEVTVADNQYGFLCYPKSFGKIESVFIGGFETTLTFEGEVSFTNASGYTTAYYVSRTGQHSLGKITMEVK